MTAAAGGWLLADTLCDAGGASLAWPHVDHVLAGMGFSFRPDAEVYFYSAQAQRRAFQLAGHDLVEDGVYTDGRPRYRFIHPHYEQFFWVEDARMCPSIVTSSYPFQGQHGLIINLNIAGLPRASTEELLDVQEQSAALVSIVAEHMRRTAMPGAEE
jgi:hypothetical protein